jgi:hypothetical protein
MIFIKPTFDAFRCYVRDLCPPTPLMCQDCLMVYINYIIWNWGNLTKVGLGLPICKLGSISISKYDDEFIANMKMLVELNHKLI